MKAEVEAHQHWNLQHQLHAADSQRIPDPVLQRTDVPKTLLTTMTALPNSMPSTLMMPMPTAKPCGPSISPVETPPGHIQHNAEGRARDAAGQQGVPRTSFRGAEPVVRLSGQPKASWTCRTTNRDDEGVPWFSPHLELLLGYVLAAQDNILPRVVVLLHRRHSVAEDRRFVHCGIVQLRAQHGLRTKGLSP